MSESQLGTLAVLLNAKTADFTNKMDLASKSLKGTADHMKTVSMAAGVMTAAVAGVGVLAIKQFAGFEYGMARVKAVSQASEAQFQTLEKAALKLGSTTEFSAKQAADGMGFLAMAGFEVNKIVGAMPSALQLATAGNMDLGRAADIASNILTGMGLKVEELAGANDVLVTAMTSTNVDLGQLGEAFKLVGPVAKSAGIEFNDIAASIGLLGNAGLQGSIAGTSLRMAIASLLKPSTEAKKVIADLGLKVKDTSGNLLPFGETLKQLETTGISTTQQLQLFGIRAGPAMAALLEQGTAAFDKLTEKMKNSGGIAERIQKQQLATLSGQFKILQSAVEGLAISMGKALAPTAASLIKVFQKTVNWFNSFSDTTKQNIASVGVLVTALGGLLTTMTAIAALLPSIISGFKSMGVVLSLVAQKSALAGTALVKSFGPALGVIGPLAVILASVLSILGQLESVGVISVDGIIDAFAKLSKKVTDFFNKLLKPLIKTFDLLGGAFGLSDVAKETIKDVMGSLVNPIKVAKDFAKGLKRGAKVAVAPMQGIFEGVAQSFAGDIQKEMKALKLVAQSFAGDIQKEMKALKLVDNTGKAAGASVITSTPSGVASFTAAMGKAREMAIDLGQGFEIVTHQFSTFDRMLNEITPGLAEAFAELGLEAEDLKKVYMDQATAITSSIQQMMGSFGEGGRLLSDIIEGMKQGGFFGAIAVVVGKVVEKMESLHRAFDALMQVVGAVAKLLEALDFGLTDFITKGVTALSKGINGLTDGIKYIVNQMKKAAKEFWDEFLGAGKSAAAIAELKNNVVVGFMEQVEIMTNFMKEYNMKQVKGAFGQLGQFSIEELVGVTIKDAMSAIGATFADVENVFGADFTNMLADLQGTDIGALFGAGATTSDKQLFARIFETLGLEDFGKELRKQVLGERLGIAEEVVDELDTGIVDLSKNMKTLDETVQDVTESLLNVPMGFKIAAARFAATEATPFDPRFAGAPGAGSNTFVENVQVNEASNLQQIENEIKEKSTMNRFVTTGSSIASTSNKTATVTGGVI